MARERGTVRFKFLADARDLSRGMKQAERELKGFAGRSQNIFQRSFGKITSIIGGKFGAVGNEASAALNGMASSAIGSVGAIGTTIAAGAAVAGAAVVGIAAKGISAFQNLASEIRGMQRATGASAEDASRLVATLNAMHVETSAGERAFFLLSKTIDTNSKKLTDHGIAIAHNKDGSVDLYGTLMNVRTAYRAAGAGAEGSAIAAAAFGRSAQSLLPILGATSARLNEIDEAAQKHHEFLSQDQIDKAKQLGIASTELHHAIEGLSIELGSALAPRATSAAKGLGRLVEAGDAVGKVFFGIGPAIGNGINKLFGLHQGHKQAAASAKENADAEQDFADVIEQNASQALATYTKALDDNLGAHLKALDTSSSYGDALQKLADDNAGVEEATSGATAEVRTFQDAMHDGFDSVIDANEATLDYLDSVDALNEALHGTAQGSEDASDAMDRLTHGGKIATDPRAVQRATNAVVKAAEREVDAMVESGQVADTAEARKEALRQKLMELKNQFPEVAGAIDQYIGRLDKIPNLTTSAETSTKKLSKAKKDLSADIRDVVQKAKDEIEAMKLSGTQVDQAWEKHWRLLAVLNYLKAAYPALGKVIDAFLGDVNTSWDEFIHSPAFTATLGNAFAPGSFGMPVTSTPNPSLPSQEDQNRSIADEFGGGSFGAPTAPGSLLDGPTTVHVEQNIYGDGLNSKEVADLSATRVTRALVGSRAA